MKCRLSAPLLVLGAALYFAAGCSGAVDWTELKVLVDSDKPPSAYDPVALNMTREYFISENLFSPLLGYSADNELVSELAESFAWSGDEAVFAMRPGLKTAGGAAIDAYDAEFSLKRAFVLGGISYRFLSRMLCGSDALKKISDPCPGVSVRDGGRTLALKLGSPKPYIFHLLANTAYAVVPRGSADPATLKITDYRNTSGPYFVESSAEGGDMAWRANPAHYRYSPKMPLEVRIVGEREYTSNEAALDLLDKGKVDYLPAFVVLKPEDKDDFAAAHGGYSINFSRPIRMIYAVFTGGMKRLSREERFFIARKLRALYPLRRRMNDAPYQLFSMEGALSRGQLAEVRAALDGSPEMVIRKTVEARRLYSYFWLDGEEIAKWLPGLVYADKSPARLRKNPPPTDLVLGGGDIGYQEDVGLVLFYLEKEFFDMQPLEKEKWLAAYVAAGGKEERMRLLRELQYRTLAAGRVVPIGLMPYASLARKPWKFNYPAAIAGDHLWRLRRK